MAEWNDGTPDATVAERLAAKVLLRKAGTTDPAECNASDFLQQDANGEVTTTGMLRAGSSDAPSGGIWGAMRYLPGQMPHVFGGMYSSAKILIGYGVRSSTTAADTFLSSIDNTSWARGALVVGNDLKFYSAGAQATAVGSVVSMSLQFTIDGSGNAGFGTATPGYKIHAYGGPSTSILSESNTNYGGQFRAKNTVREYSFGLTGAVTGDWVIYDAFNAQLMHSYLNTIGHQFYTAGTERMRIDTSGLVLIGRTNASLGGGNGATLQIGSGGGSAGLTIHSAPTGIGDMQFADSPTGAGSYAGLIRYTHTNDQMEIWTSGIARLVITAGGNLVPNSDNAQDLGAPANRMRTIFAGTGTINTSDERAKRDIGIIPDEWLDAWGAVQWVRYKFTDGNRWHAGLIAQQVHAAFAAKGLDAFEIGLCCFDQWEEQRQPIYRTETQTRTVEKLQEVPAGEDEEGQPLFRMEMVECTEEYEEQVDTGETEVVQAAGDRWSLRYDECQAMEAAWQRRERARDRQMIATLEARLAQMEGR